jgi:hypothetical protein
MAKGNVATLIALGGLKKPKGEPAESDEMEDTDELDVGDPIDELFDVIKSGDKAAFKEAFKSAAAACKSEDEEY